MSISKFHIYGVGIVSADKDEDGSYIEVFMIENQTYVDGDIDYKEVNNIKNESIYSDNDSIVLNRRVTVKADWLALGNSNRVTAPNVKKGEEVLVYRYANTDEFFWVTIYNELDLRRKEKVIHMYGNTDNFKEELNEENSYWTKVDTINKKLHLHTSDNDGEHTTYDLTMDTLDGKVMLEDGKGNSFTFNSSLNTITINTLGSVIVNTPISMVNAAASASIVSPLVTIKGALTTINP